MSQFIDSSQFAKNNDAALAGVASANLASPLLAEPVINTSAQTATLPALFISHGTPTLAIEQSATTNALAKLGQNLPTPKAIIIMSAHWISSHLELSTAARPTTWHDYNVQGLKGYEQTSSFASHQSPFSSVNKTNKPSKKPNLPTSLQTLLKLRYSVDGMPNLAIHLAEQLQNRGIDCRLNPIRAMDHGVWSPLLHMYPNANVPLIQVSLPQHYDSYACYQLGALFAKLRKQQILVIGSGNITHELAAVKWHATTAEASAEQFKNWLLRELKTDPASALDWQQHPKAGQIHQSSEHILPLFFALGAGQRVSVVHQRMAHHSLGMDIYRFD